MAHHQPVLITRPLAESRRMAEQVAGLGFMPVIAPLLVNQPLAVPPTFQPDTLIITSQQAAHWAIRHLQPGQPVCLAVGARTAAILQEGGFTDVREAAGNVASLQQIISKQSASSWGQMLYARGEIVRADLRQALLNQGYAISEQIVYQMAETENYAVLDQFWRNKTAGIVTLFSARTASLFADHIRMQKAEEYATRHAVLCFAPGVLHSVRFLPWRSVHICETTRMDCMLDQLAKLAVA